MSYEVGSVIARRILKNREPDGRESEVHVLIGQPTQRLDVDGDIQDWYCPVQILGIGDDRVRAAFGEDSFQALYLALVMTGQLLKTSVSGRKGKLTWYDVPNYGFPFPGELELPLVAVGVEVPSP